MLVCTIALIPLAARALFWLPAYQERRVANLSLAELEMLTRREPENSMALLRLGQRLNQSGRFSDALAPLQNAAGLEPDSGKIREEWALAQMAGSYVTGAFGQLTQFVKTHPESPEGRRALGRFYVTQRAYPRAIEELGAATKLAPNDAESWSLLAAAHHGLGESQPACAAAERAVQLRPTNAVDTTLLATLYQETHREADALRLFEKAATLSPGDPIVSHGWASALLKTGRPDDLARAETLAQELVSKSPGDPAALALRGRAELERGKPEKAVVTLSEAAMRVPPGTPISTLPANEPTQFLDPALAMLAAQACTALGRSADARKWQSLSATRQGVQEEWRRLTDRVRNNPEDRASFREMAALLARRGDAAEVAKYLARAESRAVDSPPVLIKAARLLSAQGYGEQAVAVARRAVLLGPRSPESHEALGEMQLAAGRGHEAAVAFSHAASWVPARQPGYRARLEEFYRRRAQSPTDAERLLSQAQERDRAGLGLDSVEADLVRASRLEPKNTDVLRYLLKTLYRREKWTDALPVAERLLAVSPEDAIGLSLRATVLLEQPGGNPNLELLNLDLLKAALEEELAPVLYAQGLLALKRGKPTDAATFLQKSIGLAPTAKTYERLIEALDRLGDTAGSARARAALQNLAHSSSERKMKR